MPGPYVIKHMTALVHMAEDVNSRTKVYLCVAHTVSQIAA